jgi:hypothetical protein
LLLFRNFSFVLGYDVLIDELIGGDLARFEVFIVRVSFDSLRPDLFLFRVGRASRLSNRNFLMRRRTIRKRIPIMPCGAGD